MIERWSLFSLFDTMRWIRNVWVSDWAMRYNEMKIVDNKNVQPSASFYILNFKSRRLHSHPEIDQGLKGDPSPQRPLELHQEQ